MNIMSDLLKFFTACNSLSDPDIDYWWVKKRSQFGKLCRSIYNIAIMSGKIY